MDYRTIRIEVEIGSDDGFTEEDHSRKFRALIGRADEMLKKAKEFIESERSREEEE